MSFIVCKRHGATLDAIEMTEMSQLRGLGSTRSPSQARAQNEEYMESDDCNSVAPLAN